MQTQEQISADRLRNKLGRTIDILVDEIEERCAIGRSSCDAPGIDGNVYLDTTSVNPGDMVQGVVQHTDAHDLWASLVV